MKKKLLATVTAVVVATASLVMTVPSSAAEIKVDSLVKPGEWYEFDVTRDGKEMTFGMDFSKKTKVYYEIRNNYDTQATGSLTVTIENDQLKEEKVFKGEDCYVKDRMSKYESYRASYVKDNPLPSNRSIALDSIDKFLNWTYNDASMSIGDAAVNTMHTYLLKKVFPVKNKESFTASAGDVAVIRLKGDTKGDSFRVRFSCDEDNLLNTDHFYSPTGSILLKKGNTLDLSKKGAKYYSSNGRIAYLDEDGIVHALSTGRTTVTVKTSKKVYTYELWVYDKIKPKVSKTKDIYEQYGDFHQAVPINMKKGETLDLAITGIVETHSVRSSDSKIVKVTQGGSITARKKGTATVTLKIDDFTWKYKITVK